MRAQHLTPSPKAALCIPSRPTPTAMGDGMPNVPTRAKPFQTLPNRSNAPHARTPAQNEATLATTPERTLASSRLLPNPANRMQPDATNSKSAKRSQVPIWHTPIPPSLECAKFPNEPTTSVTQLAPPVRIDDPLAQNEEPHS
jgi:hypothetical protein